MPEIGTVSKADYPELLSFLDRAFGFEPEKNGFLTFLPKLYSESAEPWRYNAVTRNPATGAISAALGLYPLRIRVAERRLSCMALGNMAVDAHARGQGLMSLLMQDAVERCRREGYDLAVLGGQRQRYARFGFEGNCADRTFRLTGANFRHCDTETSEPVTVRPLEREDPLLPELLLLHDAQPVHAERDAGRFYDILLSWSYLPCAALRSGKPIGYFLRKGNEIREPVLRDPCDLLPVLKAAGAGEKELMLCLCPWETGLCLRAAAVAEAEGMMQWERFAVFRFVPVLQAFLALRTADCVPDDGRLTVRIENGPHTENLTLTVRDGVPVVRESGDLPELTLSYPEAMAFFFGNYSPARQVIRSPIRWLFPLPLSLRMADHA